MAPTPRQSLLILLTVLKFLASQANASASSTHIVKGGSNLKITQNLGAADAPIVDLIEAKDDSNRGWKSHPVLTGQLGKGKLTLIFSNTNAAFRAYRPQPCSSGDVDITKNLRIYEVQSAVPKLNPKQDRPLQAFSKKSEGTWQVETWMWANQDGHIRANCGGKKVNIKLQRGWNTTLFTMMDDGTMSEVTASPRFSWGWRE